VTTDAVVERAWDPVKGPVDAKTGAGRRAVPMAFVVRRELTAHEARTGRDGRDLVFGRTANAAGLDWKQISTWRATAVSARPGTAMGTSCQAARTRQENVSMRSSRRNN
jgi:hypothetical protein